MHPQFGILETKASPAQVASMFRTGDFFFLSSIMLLLQLILNLLVLKSISTFNNTKMKDTYEI